MGRRKPWLFPHDYCFVIIGECRLTMENVHLRRLVEPRLGNIAARAFVEGKHCTFTGLDLKVTGTAIWVNSLINGQLSEPGAAGADLKALWKLVPPPYQSHQP